MSDKRKEVILFFETDNLFEVSNLEINLNKYFIGYDAEKLMIDFKNKFKVNMNGFLLKDYFYGEHGLTTYIEMYLFQKKKITIQHLINVANKSRWFPPDF